MPESSLPARRRRAATTAACLAASVIAGCSNGSSSTASSAASGATGPGGFDGAALPAGVEAPAFALIDQHGRGVSLASYRGRVVVVSFVYTTCASCALVAQQIRGALDQLATPAPVLLVSAEPAADTPGNVARFLGRVSLSARAEYLSAPRARLQRVWRAYRITPPRAGRGAFERAASVLLIDRQGRERVVFGLEQLTPESLAHDIGKLRGG
jgi:protein SCO1/2